MLAIINAVDQLSTRVGQVFAWCVMGMVLGISYEVLVRYVFLDPTAWALDLSYVMYGTLFMMAGAYTLSRNGHVRGDVLQRLWPPKTQATVDLILYLVFFMPGVMAMLFVGWKYAHQSYTWGETSIASPADVPIWQFKMVIPAAGLMLLLQGIAEICRCLYCLKMNRWPDRLSNVEEIGSLSLSQLSAEAGDAGADDPTEKPPIPCGSETDRLKIGERKH